MLAKILILPCAALMLVVVAEDGYAKSKKESSHASNKKKTNTHLKRPSGASTVRPSGSLSGAKSNRNSVAPSFAPKAPTGYRVPATANIPSTNSPPPPVFRPAPFKPPTGAGIVPVR